MTAVSASSGEVLWSANLAPATDSADDATGGGLAFADGRLYVSLGRGVLSVLNASDGTEVWTQNLDAAGTGAPTIHDGLVYLTSGDDTGWAVEKDSGRVRWTVGGAEAIGNILGGPAPVIANDLMLFAYGSGDVQAVFRKGGLLRWNSAIVGQRRGYAISNIGDITAAPVVVGDTAYVGNQSGRIVAISIGSGERAYSVA